MATGHLNPGYHNSITNLYRTTSNTELSKPTCNSLTPELANKRWLISQPSMPEDVLEKIRREARENWLQIGQGDAKSMTSYSGNYQYKKTGDRIVPRPESPSRKNNPHPSLLFMRCHMHKMKEFSDDYMEKSRPATTSVSRATNLNDLERGETDLGNKEDEKQIKSRPKTAAAFLSANRNSLLSSNQISSNHSSRPSTCLSINKNHPIRSSSQSRPNTTTSNNKPITVPPIKSPLSCNPVNHFHSRSFSKKRYSNSNNNLIYHNKSNRYPRQDYAIHYQWPTTIPHHQLF